MRISIAILAKSVLVHAAGRETTVPVPEPDTDEAWARTLRSALRSLRVRPGPAVVGLPGERVAVLQASGSASAAELQVEAARLLQMSPESLTLARGGPSAVAVPSEYVARTAARLRLAGIRPVRADVSGAALLRAARLQDAAVVAYITENGCEIAAGSARLGLMACRTVPAGDVAVEILRTASYLSRAGAAPSAIVLGGGPREILEATAGALTPHGIPVHVRSRRDDLPVGAALASPGFPAFSVPLPGVRRVPIFHSEHRALLARTIASRRPSPEVLAALRETRRSRIDRDLLETFRRNIPPTVWLERLRVEPGRWTLEGNATSVIDAWNYALSLGARVTSLRAVTREGTVLYTFTAEFAPEPARSRARPPAPGAAGGDQP